MLYTVSNVTRMNNKQAIIGIVVAILVMGASLWYLAGDSGRMDNGSTASSTAWTATSTTQTPTGTTSGTKTGGTKTSTSGSGVTVKTAGVGPLTYLFSLSQNYKCVVTTTSATTKRSGTIYVSSGGSMYGLFTGVVNGAYTTTNMIDDGTYIYIWTAGSTAGLRLPATGSVNGNVALTHGGVDPAQTLSYTCNPWTPDSAILALPTSVTFSGYK